MIDATTPSSLPHRLVTRRPRAGRHQAARALFVMLLCCLTACGTMQGFQEPPDSPDDIAIIQWSNWTGGVRVKSLDGELPSFDTRAEILPGEHIVNIVHSPNLGLTTYSATLSFEAEPGGRYKIDAECGTLVKCRPFWSWIEDLEAGTIVAGEKPE